MKKAIQLLESILTSSERRCSCWLFSRALPVWDVALSFLVCVRVTAVDAVGVLQPVHEAGQGVQDLLKVRSVGGVALPAVLHQMVAVDENASYLHDVNPLKNYSSMTRYKVSQLAHHSLIITGSARRKRETAVAVSSYPH